VGTLQAAQSGARVDRFLFMSNSFPEESGIQEAKRLHHIKPAILFLSLS
jgi:hypothetical protein